jgi:hypothetical protein
MIAFLTAVIGGLLCAALGAWLERERNTSAALKRRLRA